MIGRPARKERDGLLQCTTCERYLPRDAFCKTNATHHGVNTKCKECVRAYWHAKYGRPRKKQEIIDGKKKCSICKEMCDVSEFSPNKVTSTGLDSRCRRCSTDRVQIAISSSIRRSLMALKCASSSNVRNGSRAKRRGMKHSITTDFLVDLWERQCGKCAITGIPMTHIRGDGFVGTNVSIDRIDSSGGYTPDNVQLVCGTVNLMKNTMTVQALKYWCHAIIDGINSNQLVSCDGAL